MRFFIPFLQNFKIEQLQKIPTEICWERMLHFLNHTYLVLVIQ